MTRSTLFLLAALLLPLSGLRGQDAPEPIPLSQFGKVTQRLGTTEISVEYRRPVARGRDLFGALVPFGQEWTPAADSAALLTVSDDVTLAGEPVPAGSYSIWIVPRPGGEPWTLILSRAARVFHAPYPAGQDLLRVELTPETGEHMETLSFHFPRVEGPEALLHLQWGETVLPIPLALPPRSVPGGR